MFSGRILCSCVVVGACGCDRRMGKVDATGVLRFTSAEEVSTIIVTLVEIYCGSKCQTFVVIQSY